jgi:2-oxoisovalerate dehydrogenase E1 component
MELTLKDFQHLASAAPAPHAGTVDAAALRQAILIREVEQKFLELFTQGRMNGTVHTCIGQEFSAVAVAGQLQADDWITSNHRCHGHFVAKTGLWPGLIDELMGLDSGVCRGVGSSQHLYAKGFLSNGPQAALVPVAGGIALHHKHTEQGPISASFIGEGTLGEGTLYEALNLASLWQLPQLFVCENNLYSQSTPQAHGVSGTIAGRAKAFGITCFETNTWDVAHAMAVAKQAIDHVRTNRAPAFLVIRTYRLNAHSKGDDDRQKDEVAYFIERDPLNRLLADPAWQAVRTEIKAEIDRHVENSPKAVLDGALYLQDQLPRKVSARKSEVANEKIRMVQALNRFYMQHCAEGAYMVGEDIADPYGGAFKVTKGLSSAFPRRVISTPISESGIAGVATGLALMGNPSYLEIMFGDFITCIFDQVVSNMSKFHHMYGLQPSAPVRIRTPMGGKRGYGPTHSQSLEKHFMGIDNLAVVALTSLVDPAGALEALKPVLAPALIVENKVDYGKFLWQGHADYSTTREGNGLGSLVLSPHHHRPTVTVVAYGETARDIADNLEAIFTETDFVVELVVPILLHPMDMRPIQISAQQTGLVVVVEDGSSAFGFGSEVLAQLAELEPQVKVARLGAEPVPVPSVASLEKQFLPSARKLITRLQALAVAEAH